MKQLGSHSVYHTREEALGAVSMKKLQTEHPQEDLGWRRPRPPSHRVRLDETSAEFMPGGDPSYYKKGRRY